MSNLPEAEISRKISMISVLSAKYDEKRKSLPPIQEKIPEDPFYVVHISCFFLGFMTIVPMIFFSTAAAYWMYKFRDPTLDSETTIGDDRTVLQSYFQPSSMMGQTIPLTLNSMLLTVYGHKIPAMKRTIFALAMFIVLFATFALFTQINTDSWQTGFFVLTIVLLVLNSSLLALVSMSSVVLMAKLPQNYMFFYLMGQNGTVLTTSLQIVALAVTDSNQTTGLIYFLSGTFLIGLTLTLLLIARSTKLFKHFNVEDIDDSKLETTSLAQAKEIVKQIWPCQIVLAGVILSASCTNPSLTTLVVSQYEEDKTAWTRKYFTPVGFFLVIEFASILGRISSKRAIIMPSTKWWYIIAVILRLLLTVFLYVFSNAKPRSLPVIFGEDWEFFVINAFTGFTSGFLLSISFMSVRFLVKDGSQGALKMLNLTLAITSTITAANGLLMVKLINL